MPEFSEIKHGYSPEEVNSYLNKLQYDYEDRLLKQKDRIFELLEEVQSLNSELAEYRAKDEKISEALVNAVAKAKEIENEAEVRYENEIERLKQFHIKWVKYYNEIAELFPVDDNLRSVENFLVEMNALLASEAEIKKVTAAGVDKEYVKQRKEFLEDYRREKARNEKKANEKIYAVTPAASAKKNGPSFLNRILADKENEAMTFTPLLRDEGDTETFEEGEGKFDMREVLNPGKKLNLEDLCRQLNLMKDENDNNKPHHS